jgi:hypothetical protein
MCSTAPAKELTRKSVKARTLGERPSAIILDSWWELEHAVGDMVNDLAIETRRPANIRNCLGAARRETRHLGCCSGKRRFNSNG